MNDEQKEWYKQFSSSIGTKEFLRFGCAFVLWLLLGTTLAVLLRVPIIEVAFLLAVFVYAPVATRWMPAYRLLRRILGNREMPPEPWPRSAVSIPKQPRPWWSFIPSIWFWLLTILVLYLAIRYLAR
jgi:hypothetical protein